MRALPCLRYQSATVLKLTFKGNRPVLIVALRAFRSTCAPTRHLESRLNVTGESSHYTLIHGRLLKRTNDGRCVRNGSQSQSSPSHYTRTISCRQVVEIAAATDIRQSVRWQRETFTSCTGCWAKQEKSLKSPIPCRTLTALCRRNDIFWEVTLLQRVWIRKWIIQTVLGGRSIPNADIISILQSLLGSWRLTENKIFHFEM